MQIRFGTSLLDRPFAGSRTAQPSAIRFGSEEDSVDFGFKFEPGDEKFDLQITLPPVNQKDRGKPTEDEIKWNKYWHKAYLKQETAKMSKETSFPVDSLEMAEALERRTATENSFSQTKEYFLRYILQVRKAHLKPGDPLITKTHLALANVLFPFSSVNDRYSKWQEWMTPERRTDAILHYEAGLRNMPPSDEAADALQCIAELKYQDDPAKRLKLMKRAADMLINLHGYEWKWESSSHTEYEDGSTFGFSSSGPSRLASLLYRMKDILETPEGANAKLLERVTHQINYGWGLDYLPYVHDTIAGFHRSIAMYREYIEQDQENPADSDLRQLAQYEQNLPSWEEAVPETEAKIAAAKAYLGIKDEVPPAES